MSTQSRIIALRDRLNRSEELIPEGDALLAQVEVVRGLIAEAFLLLPHGSFALRHDATEAAAAGVWGIECEVDAYGWTAIDSPDGNL